MTQPEAAESQPRSRRLGLLIVLISIAGFYGGIAAYLWK